MVVGRVHFHKFWASLISREGFATQPLTNRNYKKDFSVRETAIRTFNTRNLNKKGIMKIIGWKMKLARASLSIMGEVLNREGTTNL